MTLKRVGWNVYALLSVWTDVCHKAFIALCTKPLAGYLMELSAGDDDL